VVSGLALRIAHRGAQLDLLLNGNRTSRSDQRLFSFALAPQEAEDIRWYLEDYRVYPVDPQPAIAARIAGRMAAVGRELFRQVVGGSDLWPIIRQNLHDARIEIETELDDAWIPWELMRDPDADLPLALQVASFVRRHSHPALPPDPPPQAAGKVRILLAICRRENDPVPFRSVARHMIRGLTAEARQPFALEVLRPATFEQLARRLREADARGEPFHILHFDGHGLSREVFFENPAHARNAQSVNPADLGKLLHATRVPLLILNACRSAAAEPPPAPEEVGDLHRQIREFGSFAHGVMDYGASGVVAWRYSVFVDTAAQFMADLYAGLASGLPLGGAATLARKHLSSGGRAIEDWTVPVVFEAAPMRLFPQRDGILQIRLEAPTADPGLPQAPGAGFIGRDETILHIDRAFSHQNIVLLHGYAGSGKTSTASEFVRWYAQTGGIAGPALFTSFEQHKPLARALDDLGRAFQRQIAQNRIEWLTLTDAERRNVALQLVRQVSFLWIWDNVEPVSGFPTGAPSAWSAAEQQELSGFLREAQGSKAKFLLTSRRDERPWLQDLPARIALPPMPFEEAVQLTRALAQTHGRRLEDVEDWRPLVRFTQGNPLTLTVVVGQALRDGLKTRDQVAGFVRRLEAGEPVFEDEATEKRSRSLAASLAYGFDHAFTGTERRQLALLYLFQGFVWVEALRIMGDPARPWHLDILEGLTREAGIALLDRAAEVGLLASLRNGHYAIHPALPWFFRRQFDEFDPAARRNATRAFAEAMGVLGDQYHLQSQTRDITGFVAVEERNLLEARRLARANGWWGAVTSVMQGLRRLYQDSGRMAEWSRLVEEIVPDFVDPVTESPVGGRDEDWAVVMGYRVHIETEARRLDQAEHLQNLTVDWARRQAAPVLAKPPATRTILEKNVLHTLAASLEALARVQEERGSPKCADGYREAFALSHSILDSAAMASCALDLARAYEEIAEIRDLSVAEQWCRQALGLFPAEEALGRGACLGQLGKLAYWRFREAQQAGRPAPEQIARLAEAEQYFRAALRTHPPNALSAIANDHNYLGNVYDDAGQADAALAEYSESVRLYEAVGNTFGSGNVRSNAARTLAFSGRLVEARDWLLSALRDFQASANADEEIVTVRRRLQQVESALQAAPPGPSGL